MAMPELFWMVECKECGARRVVYDTFREEFYSDPPADDGDAVGPPVQERYGCLSDCSAGMRLIGSSWDPKDGRMTPVDSSSEVEMTSKEISEWTTLYREERQRDS